MQIDQRKLADIKSNEQIPRINDHAGCLDATSTQSDTPFYKGVSDCARMTQSD